MQQHFSEIISSQQTPGENERLLMKHQRRIEAANRIVRKQTLESNQLIQQLNQLDTGIHHYNINLKKAEMKPSISKKVPPQQVAWSEFSVPTTFVFHVIVERRKRAFRTDAISFTENLKYNSKSSLLFEKHCNDFYSVSLIQEHDDFFIIIYNKNQYKTSESSSADELFTIVFDEVENVKTGVQEIRLFIYRFRMYAFIFSINCRRLVNF